MIIMFNPLSPLPKVLSQVPASPQPSQSPKTPLPEFLSSASIWMYSTLGMVIVLIAFAVYTQNQLKKLKKKLKFEQFKHNEVKKKLKLALVTIKKLETNPDLVHSREFNLDYLRMRMDEEVFHAAIVNRIKIRIKDVISTALRPNTSHQTVGVASTSGRQIDETFDVTYETMGNGVKIERVLFRIQVKLVKLPTQSTNATIAQIIECIEKYLGPEEGREGWQPTIHGRIVVIQWDQKAKPTPLLVLETREGGNVTMRNPSKNPTTKKKKRQRAKSKSS